MAFDLNSIGSLVSEGGVSAISFLNLFH